MALMDWVKRLITPRVTSRPTPAHRAATQDQPPVMDTQPPRKPTVASTPTAPAPVAPVTPRPTPTVTTQAKPEATLVIRLVDTHDRPLQPALVLTGRLGETVHLTFPTIAGYVLLRMDGMTQTFLNEYGLTTLIYQRQWGQPITTYLIDYDSGQLLALPRLQRDVLGATFQFTPPAVDGYHIFRAQGDQYGTYTTHPQRLLYFYRRDAWQTVQRVEQYVTLTTDHAVYDLPAGQAYGYQFPAQSLWRLFAIITLTDQSVWYNLGGNQWLSAQDTQRHEHRERHLEIPRVTQLTGQDVQLTGTVDYIPHGTVMIYREPYGEIAGQLANGELLEIRRRVVDDQQLRWYQIGPAAYINARYVRLAKQL
ncbi:MucBP domain-containing protein [Levilactobacillus zymae]|uniref:MucBP domain-containing protein n=1 Tax=Levilactobacillus zymae TaxID=267363 RepID=UPI0028B2D220|nr:MucBP domain-containing protein [Levilactobacillus zymae]MDT6980265.1 MucBP domain-containing protein [Levilactobacillus zymae]